jgi:hypothetical protein
MVLREIVLSRPEQIVGRNCDVQSASYRHDTVQRTDKCVIIMYVLKDVEQSNVWNGSGPKARILKSRADHGSESTCSRMPSTDGARLDNDSRETGLPQG